MILTLLLIVAAFCVGAIIGIIDCKRTFEIPRKATAADGEWLTHETLDKIYGYNHNRNSVSTEQ